MRMVKLLNDFGSTTLSAMLERLSGLARDRREDAVIQLSTAHKSKGLQSRVVSLADDFWSLERRISYRQYLESKDEWTALDERDFDQELNLLYVAVTRAQEHLFLPDDLFEELA